MNLFNKLLGFPTKFILTYDETPMHKLPVKPTLIACPNCKPPKTDETILNLPLVLLEQVAELVSKIKHSQVEWKESKEEMMHTVILKNIMYAERIEVLFQQYYNELYPKGD